MTALRKLSFPDLNERTENQVNRVITLSPRKAVGGKKGKETLSEDAKISAWHNALEIRSSKLRTSITLLSQIANALSREHVKSFFKSRKILFPHAELIQMKTMAALRELSSPELNEGPEKQDNRVNTLDPSNNKENSVW